MAAPPNKSSSSPIPGRANPNARSSEIGNPMRRSFAGNPFSKPSIVPNPKGLNPNTPVNSPSEYPRRNSVSRESVVTLRDNEDKENGKMVKLRSPMGSKGAKNFMSPTISAASKINASPRKKILEERNEPVSDSISFSEFKIASFSPPIADLSDHKQEDKAPAAPPVSEDSKAKSDSLPKKKVSFVEPELVNLEPTFKISPPPPPTPSSIPVIAPLDSDPLASPYDPKTNYLSPRPRFLHYKPNPRVELYLSKTKEGKRLEDGFSDTDTTEEEEEDETQSESLLKETEDDVSSGEEVRAEEKQGEEKEEEEEEELVVSEPSPIDAVISDEAVEAKRESKPWSVWRSKLTALLIILSIACVSISVANSPVTDHSAFNGAPAFLKQYDQFEVLEFAKASFDGITQRFRVWYANSVSSLSELISNLRGAHKVGPLNYFNLSALVEDDVPFDGYEMNVLVPTRENGQFHIGAAYVIMEDEALLVDAEYVEEVHQEDDEASSEVEEMPEACISPDPEEVSQEGNELPGDFEDNPIPISQTDEAAQPEVLEAGISQYEVDMSSGAETEAANEDLFISEAPEVDASSEGTQSSEVDVAVDGSTENSFTKVNMLGIALFVLALIACTGFVFVRKGNNNSTLNDSDVIKSERLVTKKLDSSPTLSKHGNTFEVQPYSWDCSGESCPSEMSSYHNTSSYNNNTKGLNSLNETWSYERKAKKNQRRESMASSMDSSIGSPSYGSFTTYENIPTKYGRGDEEVITPVRRAPADSEAMSRLRDD
ncbi:hypothetical protein L484_003739 [Morus notabilis]|uniref:Uncharacterized protein n=1 Tax=Morus notabilis TaxID=981085 RepID=W9QZR6_9ROSA|nr:uncharacterized protein LOC21387263 [Morus notabilis]EXB61545.1 hypothetical protein L484_003739 [Morus notabilis]